MFTVPPSSAPTTSVNLLASRHSLAPAVDLRSPMSLWRSKLASALPLLCAIHCALAPFVILLLPALSASAQSSHMAKVFSHSSGWETWVLLLSALLSCFQLLLPLWRGQQSLRQQRVLWPIWASGVALSFAGIAQHGIWWHAGLMIAGASALILCNRMQALNMRKHTCTAGCAH